MKAAIKDNVYVLIYLAFVTCVVIAGCTIG